jgi:hypothetical protein
MIIKQEVIWVFFLLSVLGRCFRVLSRINMLLGWGLVMVLVRFLAFGWFKVLGSLGFPFDLVLFTFIQYLCLEQVFYQLWKLEKLLYCCSNFEFIIFSRFGLDLVAFMSCFSHHFL